jgi:hypothetical protein
MKQNVKKLVAALFITAAIVATTTRAFAFGENGCRWNPENPVGICLKNTEGTWDCYEISGVEQDCTSSN